MRVLTRRLLSRKVSIEAMFEFLLWAGLVHVLIGLVWTLLHYDTVTRIEAGLETLLPAGSDLIAFGLMTLLWPYFLIAMAVCGM